MGITALNLLHSNNFFHSHVRLFILVVFVSLQLSPTASATEVTLQLKWLHQFQFAGYYMAKEKGFYEDAGLNVNIQEREPHISSLRPLVEGGADFSVSDPGAIIYFSRGAPIVALAAIFQHSPSILIVHDNIGVSELSDLKGKKLRNSQGYSNAELLAMFQQAGLSMLDVEIASSELSMQSFIDGQLDALNGYLSNEPYVLDQLGIRYKIFKPVDFGIDFYGDILITTPQMIKDHPEVVAEFREASLKGWDYALEHPDEAIDLILSKYNSQNKTRAQLEYEAEQVARLILPDIVPVGYMHRDRWQDIVEVFKTFGSIDQSVNLGAFLHQPLPETYSVRALYQHYRYQILVGIVFVVVFLLVIHNRMLKRQVLKSTHALQQARILAEGDARTDILTGIPNRRHFYEVLNRDLEHARRNGQNLSMVMIDIDNFKQINDSFGHATGDNVLKQVGRFFQTEIRTGDFCARIGGEEFVLLYRDTSIDNALVITERLRQLFREQKFYGSNSEFSITLSMGLTCLKADETADQLMSFADSAMYKAKSTGKDRIVVMH